jgi:hypothetical protein
MVKKLTGYLLSLTGLAGLLLTNIPKIKETFKLKIPLANETLMIISVALIVLGIVLLYKKKKTKENRYIPVKHQGKIVEYQLEK